MPSPPEGGDQEKVGMATSSPPPPPRLYRSTSTDFVVDFGERALSAAGAAVLSAILTNPLDVAKTRLQAQAAGVPYSSHHQLGRHADPLSLKTVKYTGAVDVFLKIIRQEGFARLWRGTNASLVLAIPTVGIYLPCYDIFRNWIEDFTSQKSPKLTKYAPLVAGSVARTLACIACSPLELARTRMQAFKEFQTGEKLPGIWKTLVGVLPPLSNSHNSESLRGYRILWTGLGAQLARDVPFSAICWSMLEPIRSRLLGVIDEESTAAAVLAANFSAGFVAGSVAAAVTCPFDVAKTRRQIEKDPHKVPRTSTTKTLVQILRREGLGGLFTGVGPRVARAGPSVGIVVSFYEVIKYVLHQRHLNSPGR